MRTVGSTRHPGRSDASARASIAPIRDLGRFDSFDEVPDSFGLRPRLPG